MNKSQSMGMYVILAIVVLVFISTIFMSGPTTNTSEISYTNFLQKLENKEFSKHLIYGITGSGKTEEMICEYDKDCKLPTNGFVRPGYKFDKFAVSHFLTNNDWDSYDWASSYTSAFFDVKIHTHVI
mgnify:CR=1 FL=1